MTLRLEKIFAELLPCKLLADIGCDHGYLAEAALKRGICEKVIVSDVSPLCLEKAKKLLKAFPANCYEAIVSNGLKNLPCGINQAVIAGMGGDLIVDIINNAPHYPERLIIQPMKNSPLVRKALLNNGYKLTRDYLFYEGRKFYNLIVAERSLIKQSLTDDEIEFGFENLTGSFDFEKFINAKIAKLKTSLALSKTEKSRQQLQKELERLKKLSSSGKQNEI